MPVTFSFDIEENSVHDANDRMRIELVFKRLGWEHIGGSSWRYPVLGSNNASEDWFNHVVPALMYFRAIVEHSGMVVPRFTIDAHSEAGYRAAAPTGHPAQTQPIRAAANVQMYPPGMAAGTKAILSEARLREFIADAASSLE